GGEHHHRHLVEGALAAYPAQHVEAAHPRHLHVDEAKQGRWRAAQHREQGIEHLVAAGKLPERIRDADVAHQAPEYEAVSLLVVHHEDGTRRRRDREWIVPAHWKKEVKAAVLP